MCIPTLPHFLQGFKKKVLEGGNPYVEESGIHPMAKELQSSMPPESGR